MATTMNVRLLLVVLLIAAAATVLPRTEAVEYTVGNSTGWSVLPGAAAFYTSWASNYSFAVGDVLVFNFTTGAHDVATVTKDTFDACNTANTLTLEKTGPAKINLNATGEYYFICTIGTHCAGGQKLAINVTASSGTTPTPPGVMSPPPPPPPPSSGTSASSLATTFSLIVVTIASTIFYLF